ncbi:uncharacterized protein LACBIDRAFT_329863 [Laccaria bicolor S238N-H82]|uniref:Predicted protein n=1 Tax=Laccaria bicolor (strain S238N-H82 / ATCC MYA-4686) TaxID=486041 RepID=B0DJH2_LACBS|nr:uncharacterized protein LACBIDRAFT_329863 [Laccaria bicolor S238N-H82]EDR05119.1 predicted protein [Laccaria bicolor S238N-H82]|eukprot:XP_001884084.1 predicted protein [Laccaria bicolor S238N-H82]
MTPCTLTQRQHGDVPIEITIIGVGAHCLRICSHILEHSISTARGGIIPIIGVSINTSQLEEVRGVAILLYCVVEAAAFEGQPGQPASKGALRSKTLLMVRDLARYAVRVVTITPGVFDIHNFPAKTHSSLENEDIVYPRRFGRPVEFARTVRETIRLSGGGRLPGNCSLLLEVIETRSESGSYLRGRSSTSR